MREPTAHGLPLPAIQDSYIMKAQNAQPSPTSALAPPDWASARGLGYQATSYLVTSVTRGDGTTQDAAQGPRFTSDVFDIRVE